MVWVGGNWNSRESVIHLIKDDKLAAWKVLLSDRILWKEH